MTLLLLLQVLWDSIVVEAYGNERGLLGGIKVQNVKTQDVSDVPVSGLFFAIGHEPATKFLDGQLALDAAGYIVTAPDSTATSVPGVYAAGDVQDPKWRQAITAAGSGACVLWGRGRGGNWVGAPTPCILSAGARSCLVVNHPSVRLNLLHRVAACVLPHTLLRLHVGAGG